MNITQIICHTTKYIMKSGIHTSLDKLRIKSETNNIVGQLYFNFKNMVQKQSTFLMWPLWYNFVS